MRFSLLAIALIACGSSSSKTPDASMHQDAPKPLDAPADAPADVTMNLNGGANALLWDAASSTLYLTDDNNNKLLKWTDANGIQDVAMLPNESAGNNPGGILKLADGSFLLANFGYGTQGGFINVDATGTAANLTGFDATRKRIGIAQDSAGLLYSSYFTGNTANAVGGVATVMLQSGGAGTETEVAGATTTAGFKKIVGLVATPTALYASDSVNKTIWKISVPDYTVSMLATGLPTADLLMMMPNGDILTGGGAVISRITQAGVVSALPNTGFETVHGVAYDPVAHHLFVIDHSATVGTPDKLHIQYLAN